MRWTLLVCLFACVPTAELEVDAGTDAPPLSVTTAHVPAATVVTDGGPAHDTASCTCVSDDPCWVAECVDGHCVRTPVADTTECGEAGWHCVRGECRERGCGDGYREPGPEPVREECDDANGSSQDACDACRTTIATLASSADAWSETASGQTLALHALGAGLVAWIEERIEEHEPTWAWIARRLDRGGSAIGDPIVLVPNLPLGWGGSCALASIATGWVATCDTLDGAVARQVALDGAVSPTRLVSSTGWMPRAASREGGYDVLWLEGADLVLRSFDAEFGAPTGPPQTIATDVSDFALATSREHRALVWSSDAELSLRLYADDSIVAAAYVGEGGEPAVSVNEQHVVVAWSSRVADTRGDVFARSMGVDGTMRDAVTVADRGNYAETVPSVAALATGFVIGWHERGSYGGANLAAFDVDVPELDLVRNAVMPPGDQGGLALASGFDDAWLLWSAGAPFGESGALRSVFMTLMAEGEGER